MAEENRTRQQMIIESASNYWKKDYFVHNANQIVDKAIKLNQKRAGIYRDLLDKMVHSILFLGKFHLPQLTPEEIFNEKKREQFKEPIEKSTTEVAVRTPFSYFLELVVNTSENEQEVKDVLTETLQDYQRIVTENQLNTNIKPPLISSVICICRVSGRNYYGGSLACPVKAKEIMTAVSCFHVWDNYVSSAVQSVFPEDKTNPLTMKLPRSVQCRAYAIEDLKKVKAPCRQCYKLYSLPTCETNENIPGNCAETEAISNLLRNEAVVKNGTRMNGGIMMNLFNRQITERLGGNGNYRINKIYKST